MEYTIRKTQPSDIDEIINLCAEHAEYERAEYNCDGKSERLSEQLFSDNPKLRCLIAENETGILGYATFTKDYSTWDAEEFIYMDCLYLRPQARSFGIGEQLVKAIAKIGVAENCLLMQWHTPPFNVRAIKFYNRIGATSKEKIRFYLDGEAVNNLGHD